MTELTDHDLNEAIAAKVCGMATRLEPFDYRKPTPPSPYVTECSGRWTLVAGKGIAEVYWNPCGDGNQVAEFVIPALRARGCDVYIRHSDEHGDNIEIVRWSDTEEDAEGLACKNVAEGETLTPRLACLAALEAFEKMNLEETV